MMVNTNPLDRLRLRMQIAGEKAQQIKDFGVFDFDHVPDQPLLRKEADQLIDELVNYKVTGIPTHHFIVGSRGSGKTLTLRFLERLFTTEAKLKFHYANCRQHNTSFKILTHLLGLPPRGLALGEVFDMFERQATEGTVVLLDELELMSPKDSGMEILYLLSRSEQPFMVIMLSNSPQVLKELDAATRSSLQPVPVHFRNYNAQQMQEILQHRAERGLHRWDEAVLAEIGALTTKLSNADARLAIKTLQYSVTGRGKDLRACFDRARRDLVVDLINDLADPILSILWAVGTSPIDFAKAIYERYCRFSQGIQEKPFSYFYFYSNLSYLQSVGLVALVSTKQGRTYTNRVILTFDGAVVRESAALRFER
jgi:Cdc6-like AAA superfamily ATPase